MPASTRVRAEPPSASAAANPGVAPSAIAPRACPGPTLREPSRSLRGLRSPTNRDPRVLVATLFAALSCGGPQPPARPVALTGTLKHYAPLTIAADAALPDLAVILGSDDHDNSSLLPLPSLARMVVIEPILGTHPTPITLTAGPAGTGSVATPPTGVHWLAELARARSIASDALGKRLADVSLSAASSGPGEPGATAALLAAGFLIALTGETIDPHATVLGALEPDGTLGPIAELPALLQRAIAHGKTRIGYPRGLRLVRTPAGVVDLVALATTQHAEAVELGDVHDAYQLLTRKQLPAPVPLAEADLALTTDDTAALATAYRGWQARLAGEWAALLQLEQAGRQPAEIARMVRLAHERSARAETRRHAGQLPAALADVRAAWLDARAANATWALIGKVAAGDVDGAVAAMIALDPGAQVGAAFAAAGALRPTTMGGHLAMLEALRATQRAWGFRELGADGIRAAADTLAALRGKPIRELGGPAAASSVADALAPAVQQMLRASAELADAELARAPDAGAAYTCTPARLHVASAERSATANPQLADAAAVEPRDAAISDDEAHRRLAAREPSFAVADRLARGAAGSLPVELFTIWDSQRDSCRAGLLQLASAAIVTREAARLILRQAIAGAAAADETALLRTLLAGVQHATRARARAARIATGAVPLELRLAYQLAAVEATGDTDDQLDAIAELWSATASADAAVVLARSAAR